MRGKAGGDALVAKRGREYMAWIGKRGAKTFWKRYKLEPVGISGWAIVNKETGIVKNFIGFNPGGKNES